MRVIAGLSSSVLTFALLFIFFHCKVSAVRFQQSPPQIVKEKTAVQINCSHDDTGLPIMLWYQQRQDSQSMTLIGYGYETGSQNYEDQFEEQFELTRDGTARGTLMIHRANLSHSAVYYCAASSSSNREAYFGAGTKLTVLEKDKEITGPSVKVLQPSPKECKNEKDKQRKKTLVCVAKDFYPDHVSVSWEINGQNVTNGVATDEAAQLMPEKKFYQITSRLRVPAKDWENSDNEFKCIVNFFNKTHTVPYTDSIYGEAVTTTNVMTREKYVKITQAAKLTYSVFIAKSCIYGAFVVFLVWKLQGSKGKQNY